MRLFISCVGVEKQHPSSLLAKRYVSEGYNVLSLYTKSRSILSLLNDTFYLFKVVFRQRNEVEEIIANVNGSISRFLISIIMLMFNVRKTSFYIMDVYPGCLRFLLKGWVVFFPFFYLLEFLSLLIVKRVIVIDEGFYELSPLCLFKHKMVLKRLKFDFNYEVKPSKGSMVGIIGNTSFDFLERNKSDIEYIMNKFSVLVASSNHLPCWLIDNTEEKYCPWNKEDTNVVFSKLKYNLICADIYRLTYCSPSKIIDSYVRGITPVLFLSNEELELIKHREIYRYCISIESLLDKNDMGLNVIYEEQELIEHSRIWR
tara:strand:+ start:1611 stop:2555 length:945 start_codon:yes stop_codon:yes gene_type:complete